MCPFKAQSNVSIEVSFFSADLLRNFQKLLLRFVLVSAKVCDSLMNATRESVKPIKYCDWQKVKVAVHLSSFQLRFLGRLVISIYCCSFTLLKSLFLCVGQVSGRNITKMLWFRKNPSHYYVKSIWLPDIWVSKENPCSGQEAAPTPPSCSVQKR